MMPTQDATSLWQHDPLRAYDIALADRYTPFSAATQAGYRMMFRTFVRYLHEREIDLAQVTVPVLNDFFKHRGHSHRTQAAYIAALGLAFDAMQQDELMVDNPAQAWMSVRKRQRGGRQAQKPLPPALLGSDRLRMLALLKAPVSGFTPVRRRAMLFFLYATGLRVTELIRLKAEHLHLEVPEQTLPFVWVMQGKGNKKRRVPLPEELLPVLQRYLDLRTAYKVESEWLFCKRNGNPLTRFGVYRMAEAFFRAGRIQVGQKGPHVYRHTFATRQLENGVDAATVKVWLGHERLSTLLNTYEHVVESPNSKRPV